MTVTDDRLEEAFLAYLKEAEAGHAPDRAEFLARYPELASELAEYLTVEQRVDTLFPPMREIFGGAQAAPSLPSFGDYEVLAPIVVGGMGIVYRARQKSLNRLVALKVIKNPQLANTSDRQRFRLEAERAANLNHPHIVPIYEVGDKDGLPYFSMKLIEGGSLSQRMAEWRLPEIDPRTRKDSTNKTWSRTELRQRQDKVAHLLETAARAVHHAHQRSLLHRDLKPGNILLDEAGQPYVTDFGLAIPLQENQHAKESAEIAGTAPYMAPEQTLSDKALTVHVDVYGLGAICYELLTGAAPFQGASVREVFTKVREQQPVLPTRGRPYTARDLAAICLKCLHKDPQNRYASAEALADDLKRFRTGQPIHARPTPAWERAWMWAKRKPLVASLYSTLSLVILLAVGIGIWQWHYATEGWREAENNLYAHQVIQIERDLSAGMVDRAEIQLGLCPPHLRDWEWHYLSRWRRGDCSVLARTGSAIVSFAVHSDSKTLITGGKDGAIRLWNRDHQRSHLLVKHINAVSSMSLSKDGRILAAAYEDMTVNVWDITVFEKPDLRKELEATGKLVAVSADGRLVAVATGLNNDVRVWELAAAAGPFVLKHDAPVICFAFSPNNEMLATAGYGKGKIKIWDVAAKSERQDIVVGNVDFAVFCVAFSPDSKRIALSDGTSVALWDLKASQTETRLHGGFKGRYVSLAFSPDGRALAATTESGSVTVWETTGKVAYSARRHDDMIPAVAFQSKKDDPSLFYVRGRDLVLENWRPPAGKPVRTLPDFTLQNETPPVAFDSKNARVAIAGPDNVILVRNLSGGVLPGLQLRGAAQKLISISISGDGERLAGVSTKGIYHWNLADGALPVELPTKQTAPNKCIALSLDGQLVAVSGEDKTVAVWDVRKREEIFSVSLREQLIPCLAFSPDGQFLAAGAESGLLKVWDIRAKKEIAHLEGHRTLIKSIAFSPRGNGRYLVSGSWDGTVRLWDLKSKKELRKFEGHASAVTNVHVSPNGKRIASAGMDGVVHLWDTANGQRVLVLRDHDASVAGLAFCQDGGSLLAAVSVRGVVKVWDASPQDQAEP